MAVSNKKAVFPCDIQRVWEVVTSLENYSWRGDLSKIEIINEKQFKEYTKDGSTEIDFTEEVTARKVIMKPFVKSYLRKQQELYVSDLRKAL